MGVAKTATGGFGSTIDKEQFVTIGSAAVVPSSQGTANKTTIVNVGLNDYLQRSRSNNISRVRRHICNDNRGRLRQRNNSHRRRRV